MSKKDETSYSYSSVIRREVRHTHGLDPEVSTGKVRRGHKKCKARADGRHDLRLLPNHGLNTPPTGRWFQTRMEVSECKNCGRRFQRCVYVYPRREDNSTYKDYADYVSSWQPKMGASKGRRVEE